MRRTCFSKDTSGGTFPGLSAWVIEDDFDSARAIGAMLHEVGFLTRLFATGGELLEAIQLSLDPPDVICLDLTLPDLHGLDLLAVLREHGSLIPVIIITSNTSKESIARAMDLGAYDYLPKNADHTRFLTTFRRAAEYRRLRETLGEVAESDHLPQLGIIGISPAVETAVRQTARLSGLDTNVLVIGETGTGKNVVARALHEGGKRRKGPFVFINCVALPRDLLESELFGQEGDKNKGQGHVSAFERADNGTLFLDGIGELDAGLQAKLMGAIEKRSFFRIGGTKEIKSDFRLVAATSKDLFEESSTGRFRQDLYYRLSTTEIILPPLRSRPEDIPLLAAHFLKQFNEQLGKKVRFSPDTVALLNRYPWPGNARELQNVVQYGLIQCSEEVLRTYDLPERVQRFGIEMIPETRTLHSLGESSVGLKSLEQQEKDAIVSSLRASAGKVPEAAKILGVSRASMYRMVKRHNIPTKGYG